ncbi:MAG: glutathione S-transferase family protein [Verrucomicrobiales bacterium]|nr:glutathione S-transferase family protein [Verrucomicrobiales bacterium]
MSIQLYEMPFSPFCIPISRMLEAAGVEFERIDVPNWDRRPVIEITGGAYYQVPVLVHEGRVVFESAADSQDVARYTDTTFCNGRFFPAGRDDEQAPLIQHFEDDLEGLTFKLTDVHYVPSIPDLGDRVMVIRHKERKFGAGCVELWTREAESLRADLESKLAPLDARLKNPPFLLGEQPVYADFLLYGVLGNYTFNGWNALPAHLTALKAWRQRMAEFRLD